MEKDFLAEWENHKVENIFECRLYEMRRELVKKYSGHESDEGSSSSSGTCSGSCDDVNLEDLWDDEEFTKASRNLYQRYRESYDWVSKLRSLSCDLMVHSSEIKSSIDKFKTFPDQTESIWRDMELAKANVAAPDMEDLKPSNLIDDPFFIRIEKGDDVELVDILSNELPSMRKVLREIDEFTAIKLLPRDDRDLKVRYANVRDKICTQVKDILTRTFQKCERFITSKIETAQQSLQNQIDKQAYIERITNAALEKDQTHNFKAEEESDSFVPARWLYTKFRSYSKNIYPLIEILIERYQSSNVEIYKHTIDRIAAIYAAMRMRLLTRSFQRQLEYNFVKIDYQPQAVREVHTYWLSIAAHEIELFSAYFGSQVTAPGKKSTSLITIIKNLADIFYDTVRTKVLRAYDLKILRETHDALILDAEYRTDQPLRVQEYLTLQHTPILKLQKDICERLLLRAQAFLNEDIVKYEFTSLDLLDYPKV